ncbi:Protein phosphatase 1 regulatory subunit 14C [Galemys pyrenaicus]|uniref:Protein phosphatase 1 regulatory subunit 14 n=1 Tax=Galemys pyrenaicus TaxID=202257 RepID=A0A8J6DLL2_GALPY|nr:Protein phosphatase 1 regulatory subunit 14C [Galemys pyrenaicus]
MFRCAHLRMPTLECSQHHSPLPLRRPAEAPEAAGLRGAGTATEAQFLVSARRRRDTRAEGHPRRGSPPPARRRAPRASAQRRSRGPRTPPASRALPLPGDLPGGRDPRVPAASLRLGPAPSSSPPPGRPPSPSPPPLPGLPPAQGSCVRRARSRCRRPSHAAAGPEVVARPGARSPSSRRTRLGARGDMSVATGSSEAAGGAGGGGARVFFQSPRGGAGGSPSSSSGSSREDSAPVATAAAGQVQQQRRHQQGKVTVKYDRKELRKRLVLEEWIVEQLGQLYGCEVPGAGPGRARASLVLCPHRGSPGLPRPGRTGPILGSRCSGLGAGTPAQQSLMSHLMDVELRNQALPQGNRARQSSVSGALRHRTELLLEVEWSRESPAKLCTMYYLLFGYGFCNLQVDGSQCCIGTCELEGGCDGVKRDAEGPRVFRGSDHQLWPFLSMTLSFHIYKDTVSSAATVHFSGSGNAGCAELGVFPPADEIQATGSHKSWWNEE